MTIDRSKHDHGLHDLAERHTDAVARGVRDDTPINHNDLAQVHLAELIPQRMDNSLQGSVEQWVESNDAVQKIESAHGGENCEWDGEELQDQFGSDE